MSDIAWSMTPDEEPEIPVEIESFLATYCNDIDSINRYIKNIELYPTSYEKDKMPEFIGIQDLINDQYVKGVPGEEGMLLFVNDNFNDERSVRIPKADFLYALRKKKEELENKKDNIK